MNIRNHIIAFANEKKKENPELSDEIDGLMDLALNEISAGESADNECQLFINSVNELIHG